MLFTVLKSRFSSILKARIATTNLNRRVLDGEPRLDNFFNSIIPPTVDLPDPSQVDFQYDGRGFEDGVKVRADLAVHMANNLIIDFTFVEQPLALMAHTTKLVKPH